MSLVYSFVRQGSGSWRVEESTGPDSGYGSVAALASQLHLSDGEYDPVEDPGQTSVDNDGSTTTTTSSSTDSSSSSSDSEDSSDDDSESSSEDECGSTQSHASVDSKERSGVCGPGGDITSMLGSRKTLPRTESEPRRVSTSLYHAQETSLMQLSCLSHSPGRSAEMEATAPPREADTADQDGADGLYSQPGSLRGPVCSIRRPQCTAPLQSSLLLNSDLGSLSREGSPQRSEADRESSPMPAVLTPTRLPNAPSRRGSGQRGSPPQTLPERQLSGTYRVPSNRGDIYGRLSSLKTARILLHGGSPSWKAAPNIQNFTSNEAALWATMQQNRNGNALVHEGVSPTASPTGTGSASRRARVPQTAEDAKDRSHTDARGVQVSRGDFDNDTSLDSDRMTVAQARERASGGSSHDGMPSFVTNELTQSLLDSSVNTGATTFRLLTFQKQDDGPLPPSHREHKKKKKKDKKSKKDKKEKKEKRERKDKEKRKAKATSDGPAEEAKVSDDLALGDLVAPPTPVTQQQQTSIPPIEVAQRTLQSNTRSVPVVMPPLPRPSPTGLGRESPSNARHSSPAGAVDELNARNAAQKRREAQEARRRSSIVTNTPPQASPSAEPPRDVVRPQSATESQARRDDFTAPRKGADRIKVYTQPPAASPSATVRRTTVRPKPHGASDVSSAHVPTTVHKASSLPPLRKR